MQMGSACSHSDEDVSERVALVTGSNKGIGYYIAQQLVGCPAEGLGEGMGAGPHTRGPWDEGLPGKGHGQEHGPCLGRERGGGTDHQA